MWTDITEFRAFYESDQGTLPRKVLSTTIGSMWPDVRGLRVAGLGYSVPFMDQIAQEAERCLCFFPGAMGCAPWPESSDEEQVRNRAALVSETALPLPDRSVDRLLLVHLLEYCDYRRDILRECWRVLADSGRMIIVVPNRTGLWAHLDKTPFSDGHSTSKSDLQRLLRGSLFAPEQSKTVLYCPPVSSAQGLSAVIERAGCLMGGMFGGVIVQQCRKETAVPLVMAGASSRRRNAVRAFGPASNATPSFRERGRQD